MSELSIIIPLGNAFEGKAMSERVEALTFSINNFYKKHKDTEIIIVTQDYTLSSIEGVRIILISSLIFNKGWCVNVGARAAKGKNICIAESDMYSTQPYLNDVADFMYRENIKWCFAWNSLAYTTLQQRIEIMRGVPCSGKLDIKSPVPEGPEGGLLMFDRQFFLSIGGCNEWFEELGCPDNELVFRAKTVSGTYDMYPLMVYHLWHPLCAKHTKHKNLDLYEATKYNPNKFNSFLLEQDFGNLERPLCSKRTFEEAWDEFVKNSGKLEYLYSKNMIQKAWEEFDKKNRDIKTN